jgi:hypothetical protein
MPSRLTEAQLADRLNRYESGEPLALIARDHGVHLVNIIATVRRHAPWMLGYRARGAAAHRLCREWSEHA